MVSNNSYDIYTIQLGEYAKVNDPDRVIRDPSIHVQAVCDEELKHDYYHFANTRLFMACTIVIPFLCIATLSMVVRSFYKEINDEIAKERNHGNLAALVLIGIVVQWVIVGMDAAAVYYVFTKQHEYKDYDLQQTINFTVTAFLLAFDSIVGLLQLVCLFYVWCAMCHKDIKQNCDNGRLLWCTKSCMEKIFPFLCLIPSFYAIFGDNWTQTKVWEMPNKYTDLEQPPVGGASQYGATDVTQQPRQPGAGSQQSGGQQSGGQQSGGQQSGGQLSGTQQPEAAPSQLTHMYVLSRKISWIMLTMLMAPIFSVTSHSGYILISWLTHPSRSTSTALVALALFIYSHSLFSGNATESTLAMTHL